MFLYLFFLSLVWNLCTFSVPQKKRSILFLLNLMFSLILNPKNKNKNICIFKNGNWQLVDTYLNLYVVFSQKVMWHLWL